jgi:diguanylate cyclase (GGDEF)-like protein
VSTVIDTDREHPPAVTRCIATAATITGLATRAIADQMLRSATRRGANLTVALADIDGLHAINANFGHAAGDQYITTVAARLARAVPTGGCLVRQGGDEFTLLAPDTDPDDLAGAVGAALSGPATIAGYRIQPRASIGIADSGGDDAHYTRACADAAMYTAKEAGGNQIMVYQPDRDGRPAGPGRYPPAGPPPRPQPARRRRGGPAARPRRRADPAAGVHRRGRRHRPGAGRGPGPGLGSRPHIDSPPPSPGARRVTACGLRTPDPVQAMACHRR